MRRSPPFLWPVALALALGLAGCGTSPGPSRERLGLNVPYRADVVQGNVVTREQLALIRPGMTRLQVREVLGTPLVTDPFHADRWDYAFTIRRPGTEPQRRSVVLHFSGETLRSIEAPEVPGEKDFVASITRERRSGKEPVLELTEAQRKALPAPPPRPAAPGTQAPAPSRTYPPLEGS